MRSALPGKRTLGAEITNITGQGFWLLLDGREVFASFADFPWFAEATIRQLSTLQRPSPHHLYWPDLDIDLAVDSLDNPESYPLISKVRSNQRLQLPGRKRGGSGRGSSPKDGRPRRAPRS
jgi:hypothetical protein